MKSNKRLPGKPAEFSKRCIDLEGGSRGRDFRLYPEKGIVSISTVEGRKKLSYRCGDFQRSYLEASEWTIQAAKLVHKRRRKGWRYELHVTVTRDDPEPKNGGILGVDTGRRYLAVASTGDDAHFFPAGHLKPKKGTFPKDQGQDEVQRHSLVYADVYPRRRARGTAYEGLSAHDGQTPRAACS